jgi:hypothetical protein
MFLRAMTTKGVLLSIVTNLLQFFKQGFDYRNRNLLIRTIDFESCLYPTPVSVRARRQTIVARTLDGNNR